MRRYTGCRSALKMAAKRIVRRKLFVTAMKAMVTPTTKAAMKILR
jgi:hypothetical protein